MGSVDLLEDAGITKNGKAMILAYDQGMEHGPRDFDIAIGDYVPGRILTLADAGKFTAIVLLPGIARQYYYHEHLGYGSLVPLILKVNARSELFTEDDPYSPLLFSGAGDAVKCAQTLRAKAVGYTIYLGSRYENIMTREFSSLCFEAHRAEYPLPVIAWVYPRGKSLQKYKPALNEVQGRGGKIDESKSIVAYAARAALELGADMAKIKYSGSAESFRWAVQCAGRTKVVMSGGPKADTPEEFLAQVDAAMRAGGAGVAVGRNVWQRPYNEALELSRKLHDVIFGEEGS